MVIVVWVLWLVVGEQKGWEDHLVWKDSLFLRRKITAIRKVGLISDGGSFVGSLWVGASLKVMVMVMHAIGGVPVSNGFGQPPCTCAGCVCWLCALQRKFAAATKFQSAVRLFLQRARFRTMVHLARIVQELEWARLSRVCFKIQRRWRCLQ